MTVADVYAAPTLGGIAATLEALGSQGGTLQSDRHVGWVPRKTQVGQVLSTVPLRVISGLRWATWAAAGSNVARALWGLDWLPFTSWWWVAVGWLLLISPPGRMALTVAAARVVLRGVTPGDHPRGGKVHLRVWLAERVADELGAANLSGAPWMRVYARALGAHVGKDVDLHSVPPVTGFLHLGRACSIEQEVDLRGHWLDGDVFHLGHTRVRRGARVGARSTLLPGADVGRGAEITPGSAVFGPVPAGEWWAGAPARRGGIARGPG